MAVLTNTSTWVVGTLEKIFYRWGMFVARHPYIIAAVSLLITSIACLGMINMKYEARSDKMWIPEDSPYITNKDWIDKNFVTTGQRGHSLIFRSEKNILTPEALKEMFRLHQQINSIMVNNLTYSNFCYKLPIADIFLKRRKRSPTKSENAQDGIGSKSHEPLHSNDPVLYENSDIIIPSRLIINKPRIETNSNAVITTTPSYESEYNYDAYDQYDYTNPEEEKDLDYNVFSSLESEAKYDNSQKQISESLPASVYCDLINTLNSKCFESSILEIWRYHEETIMTLTQEDILYAINVVRKSPYFGYGYDYAGKLGGIKRNKTGHIVEANSAFHSWVTTIDKSEIVQSTISIDPQKVDQINLDWELKVIQLSLDQNEHWDDEGQDLTVKVNMARSFNDVSTEAIWVDMPKMLTGYLIMFVYAALMLGRFNAVEQRFYLTAAGLISVLMGIGIGVGITSALGFPYIPLHAMLPFICLGIGIDDMFVIVQCLHNLKPNELTELSIEEKMGLTMKHAGVAITVTSLTDMFAFGIGAVTILPGLQAFCISCAFAIGAIYVLQASWFVAWLSVDEKRIKDRRNALCPGCIRYPESWQPSKYSQKEYGKTLLIKYSQLLNVQLYKIFVVILTVCAFGVGLWGATNIKTEFDPTKLLPAKSYILDWIMTHRQDYPKDGWGADIYTGPIDPQIDLPQLNSLVNDMVNLTTGEHPTLKFVDSWWLQFKQYIRTSKHVKDQTQHSSVGDMGYNPENFSMDLSNFLFSRLGARYKTQILLDGNLTCNDPAPSIVATKTGFQYRRLSGPTQHSPARKKIEHVIESYNLTSHTFSNSKIYAAWETDEIIANELWRNMGLAMICVFVITLVLLADVTICVLVFICVVLTLVDIVGMLHWWNITIDTISCINIVLSIGLCVDYSAHIAHAFMVGEGSRIERSQAAITTMGPAIINGGITTFLAVVPLYFSESHVFLTFFKVFFLTVNFGLFHGVILLPVLLSWIGSTYKKNAVSELSNTGSCSDHIEPSNKKCEQALSNGHYVPTYNSTHNTTVNSSNGLYNSAFVTSNTEIDKKHNPNFVSCDSDLSTEGSSSRRLNPFKTFHRTLTINE